MKPIIKKGDTVRQWHTKAKIRYDEGVVTFVHGNGAIDVIVDGVNYGWSYNYSLVEISPT